MHVTLFLLLAFTALFEPGLDGWTPKNYENRSAFEVCEHAGEKALVVTRAASAGEKGGTAWELAGPSFPVKAGARISVLTRARGTVKRMQFPNGYKQDYNQGVHWFDAAGKELPEYLGFGLDLSPNAWRYSFRNGVVPPNAVSARVVLGADHPDFGTNDVLAISRLEVSVDDPAERSGSVVTLRDDGVVLTDGQPFFPIGIYNVIPCEHNGNDLRKAFAELKEIGFNTVQMNGANPTDRYRTFLDLADEMGLKTFTVPVQSTAEDIYAKGHICEARRHPSVLAWYVADDTASHAGPDEVTYRSKICKTLDPDRLTLEADIVTIGGINRYAPFVNATDVFLPEVYPCHDGKTNGLEVADVVRDMTCIREAQSAAGNPTKSVWPIIQHFDGWGFERFPTFAELRASSWASLAMGGRGIVWYTYAASSKRGRGAAQIPARWEELKRVVREIAAVKDDLLARDAAVQPAVTISSGPALDRYGRPTVCALLKEGDAPLLIVVNAAAEAVEARLDLPGLEPLQLAPYDVRLIRLPARTEDVGAIVCEGGYRGHLQGVDSDGTNIWWSFTSTLVRTDLAGHVLTRTEAPRHQGDICVRNGMLYVAVNRGRFNQPDAAVSEVMSYDAMTLAHRKTWKLDMPHGAGGMTEKDDRFYVIGGLPATHEQNYVYEYDADFNFLKRHELATGFTLMGVQTATVFDGKFYFGIYGETGDPSGVLECPADLGSFTRYTGRGAMGMIRLGNVVYTAKSLKGKLWEKNSKAGRSRRLWRAMLVPDPDFCTEKMRYEPKRRDQGLVRVFSEANGTNGWVDAGYALAPNGYEPLFCPGKLKIFEPTDYFCLNDTVPAVGIGGDRSYSAPDLIRAVRRCAENDEAFALHVPGSLADVARDAKLSAALEAVRAECDRLGVRYEFE